jgi:hypothetical protein
MNRHYGSERIGTFSGVKTPPDEPTLLDASGVDQKTRAEKTYRFYNYLNSDPFSLIRRCIV